MKTMYIFALVFVLMASAAFAESCVSSGDCADDEYCSDYQCVPYSSSGSTNCCGPAFILAAVGLVAVFFNSRN
ncbi:MAG: hypothetical protein V1492_04880 [Candidatus Micrarchaeota archaeon]